MYHFFEQQVIYFLRKEVLHPMEENNTALMKVEVFKIRLHFACLGQIFLISTAASEEKFQE
jgi:hypothetical protein